MVGAELEGIDLAAPTVGDIRTIRGALFEHGVVFFRDQRLTPAQHLTLAECFGRVNINRFFTPVDGFPGVAEVRKEPSHKQNIGGGWHTDHSYDTAPAMGSILVARDVPAVGGDTLFASLAAAHDALSEGLRQTLEGLRAVHSSRHVFGVNGRSQESDVRDRLRNPEFATQDAVHPVIIRHPATGRRALYVNPGFTLRFEGWTDAESRPLLEFLYAHATRPEFQCRFRWAPGSVAFWDNRLTWHHAVNDYPGARRLMHRVTIDGEALGCGGGRVGSVIKP